MDNLEDARQKFITELIDELPNKRSAMLDFYLELGVATYWLIRVLSRRRDIQVIFTGDKLYGDYIGETVEHSANISGIQYQEITPDDIELMAILMAGYEYQT